VKISRDLLGKRLCTNINGKYTAGIIVETEAYSGRGDQACHAHQGRFTKRTSIMYEEGGLAYVYLCYGIHHLFNVVTNNKGQADAVLVRAIEPVAGIDIMLERRQKEIYDYRLTAGPGSMSQALGITKRLYGSDLFNDEIWIEEDKSILPPHIQADVRVGIDYAGSDALKPWRFYLKGNRFVSRVKRSQ
jgi:DNA-3-methyladenine glycosylase